LTHLNRTIKIKNQRLRSIRPLHLLHRPGSALETALGNQPNATWRRCQDSQQWREAQRASDGGGARRGGGNDNVSISGLESRLDAVHANWTWPWWRQGLRRREAEQAGDSGATFSSSYDLLPGKALSSFLRFCYSWFLPLLLRR
jgi:hypothetical protein